MKNKNLFSCPIAKFTPLRSILGRIGVAAVLTFNFMNFKTFNCFAQTPPYLWAQSAGGNSNDYGNSVATDASGNILVTGSFDSPSISFGTTTLTNADTVYDDMFIVKLAGTTGIRGTAISEPQVEIHPNPTTGQFTLEMELTKPENFEIKVLNILGQTVFTGQTASDGTNAIDLTGISEGIYRLVVVTDEGIFGENVVILH